MTLLSKNVITHVEPLTSKKRIKTFIADDTAWERNRSRKAELISRGFNHSEDRYYNGFRILTLAWGDGCSVVPVSGTILSTSKAENLKCPAKDVDKRTSGYKARQLAQTPAPDVLLNMLRTAIKAGIEASHILFDSWFSFPSFILKLRKMGLHVVAMVKKLETVHYLYHDRKVTLTQIYKANRKRRGRSRYLLSVNVTLFSSEPNVTGTCPARLVFVRNRNHKEDLDAPSSAIHLNDFFLCQLHVRR